MPEIVVEGLGVDYGQTTALHEISFTAHDGEFLTLLGPSGCGKTTTLMSIAGLLRPTRGRIQCGDLVFVDTQSKQYMPPERRSCGVVFQSYAVWPHMNVFDNIAYPLKLRRLKRDEISRRVEETLALVEMPAYGSRYPHELSGGQQQRVALARALVFSPAVLLLDEPLSNLDAKLREQARVWLKEIQNRVGVTTIYVTHGQDEALSLSDRIIVMEAGKIRQIGTPQEVYGDPADPYVADFIGSSNLLDGRWLGRGQVKLDGAEIMLQVAAETSVLAPQTAVIVAVRPEKIDFAPGHSGQNVIAAKIRSSMFLGPRLYYQVEFGGVSLSVLSEKVIQEKDVMIKIPTDACQVFPKEKKGRAQ